MLIAKLITCNKYFSLYRYCYWTLVWETSSLTTRRQSCCPRSRTTAATCPRSGWLRPSSGPQQPRAATTRPAHSLLSTTSSRSRWWAGTARATTLPPCCQRALSAPLLSTSFPNGGHSCPSQSPRVRCRVYYSILSGPISSWPHRSMYEYTTLSNRYVIFCSLNKIFEWTRIYYALKWYTYSYSCLFFSLKPLNPGMGIRIQIQSYKMKGVQSSTNNFFCFF